MLEKKLVMLIVIQDDVCITLFLIDYTTGNYQ